MIASKLNKLGVFGAAGLMEEPERSLFYRKALGLRRFFENAPLCEYRGELLYPSGVAEMPNYLDGLAFHKTPIRENLPEVAEQIEEEFCRFHSSVPREHTVAGNMYTHSMPHYERILKEGLASYLLRIEKIEDQDLREGLKHLLAGIETYVGRCVSYLTEAGADEKLIAALKRVPMLPAENIYEAVVSWNFVMYLDHCDNLGCVASGLLPYYRGEDITPLLANLFENLNANDGYSMALGTDYNPLTKQCLYAAKGKRRPMIELFVDENTPDEIWDKAFELVRTGGGQPAFYNPRVLLDGLQQRFPCISDADVKRFCGGGCTESMIAGLSNVGSVDAGINLPLILERCIRENLPHAKDFEEFYVQYIAAVRLAVDTVTTEIANSRRLRAAYNPLPLRTLLIDDCIDRGLDYNAGGARYQWSIINFAGMINVIDAMLVIRDLVFDQKCYSPEQLVILLDENDEKFLTRVRRHPVCFGINDKDADAFSHKISAEIFAMTKEKELPFGEGFLSASIQFMSQVKAGKAVGATPDGRSEAAPLCDSLAAIFSKDVKGPTALLGSVTSLALSEALGVPVVNFNITPSYQNEILKSLILGYMKQGGAQLQLSCVARETLEKANQNPAEYPNLVVRVGGYSEYFCRLNDELRRMVLERSIQTEL